MIGEVGDKVGEVETDELPRRRLWVSSGFAGIPSYFRSRNGMIPSFGRENCAQVCGNWVTVLVSFSVLLLYASCAQRTTIFRVAGSISRVGEYKKKARQQQGM